MGGKRLLPEEDRICRVCGEKGEFYKGKGECKSCTQKRNRKWVAKNRGKFLAYQKTYREEGVGLEKRLAKQEQLRKIVIEEKSKPCMDCGRTFHPACMEFDHREPHLKDKDVSYLACSGHSVERLRKEIEKCDLVCAICHRMRSVKNGVYPKWYGS
jgi:hypothetical protein